MLPERHADAVNIETNRIESNPSRVPVVMFVIGVSQDMQIPGCTCRHLLVRVAERESKLPFATKFRPVVVAPSDIA